jgi:hypothetical protein
MEKKRRSKHSSKRAANPGADKNTYTASLVLGGAFAIKASFRFLRAGQAFFTRGQTVTFSQPKPVVMPFLPIFALPGRNSIVEKAAGLIDYESRHFQCIRF